MTQITDTSRGAARSSDTRIIALVCSAHFVSHFYILLLPPLFPFIREFYGVSYTQLGFALTAFTDPQSVQHAFAAGFDAHLSKPLEPHVLADALTKVLRIRRSA